jgi:hypothetical protein
MTAWVNPPPHAKPEADEPASRAEIEEALTHLAQYASRQLHHPDCTTWVTAHRRIDDLLHDWEMAAN